MRVQHQATLVCLTLVTLCFAIRRDVRVWGCLGQADQGLETIMGMSSDFSGFHSSLHEQKIIIRKLAVVFRCESETTTSHQKAEFLRERPDRRES